MEQELTFANANKASLEPRFSVANPAHVQGSIGDNRTRNLGAGMIDGENKKGDIISLTDVDSSAGGAYPQNVLAFLFFVGIISEAPSWVPIWISQPYSSALPSLKWLYVCCVRFIIVLTSMYCMFVVVVMKFSVSDADRGRAGYRWFAGVPYLKCHGGITVDYDNDSGDVVGYPCIYVYAKVEILPLFGASGLFMYGWLLRELRNSSMHLRSHASQVSRVTNTWTIKYCRLGLASGALVLVCICVSTRATLIQEGVPVHSTWFMASMGKAAGVGLGVGVNTLPFSALSLLLNTVCCRLKCAVDDALFSLTLPFDFETQAAAYQSLRREFATSQMAWGGAMGFSIVSVTSMLAFLFVEPAYIRAVHFPAEVF